MKRSALLLLCLALLTGCGVHPAGMQEEVSPVPLSSFQPEAFSDAGGWKVYTGEGYDAIQGIDVSQHQGEIDWQAVAEDGIEFVILRLGRRGYTSGGIQLDDRFEENFAGAVAAGLEVGVYFFSQAISEEEAREEARFVLDALDGRSISMPVVYDWENITGDEARTDGLDGQTITDCAVAFCTEIQQAGYCPMVYFSSYQGYEQYEVGRLSEWGFWFAGYNEWPDFLYQIEMWQYTSAGTVAGIEGNVDRDLYFLEKTE